MNSKNKWIPKFIEEKYQELSRLGNGGFLHNMTWEDLQAFPKWEDRQKRVKQLHKELEEFRQQHDSLRSKS